MSDSNDWSHGYPVGESYPASWHGFQSPAHLRAICALMGVIWEVGPGKPMCIAEVGCGTGYTALVLAAGNPGCQVIGMDYNPAHIAEARSMAEAAGIDNATFLEVDLSQLDGRALDDLPEPAPRLRGVDAVGVYRRAFHMVDFPAAKVRAADIPLLAFAIGRQHECAFARADEYTNTAHGFLLLLLLIRCAGPCGE
jgi:SAM-dependent methyltransferase